MKQTRGYPGTYFRAGARAAPRILVLCMTVLFVLCGSHAVRADDQATDHGSSRMVQRATVGSRIDLVVYGGYHYGNTPLELVITELRPRLTQIEMQEGAVSVTATNLIAGTTNALQSRSDLLDGDWSNVAVLISNTAQINLVHEDDGSEQRRFYRLVTE